MNTTTTSTDIDLGSAAFSENGTIPLKYSGEGENLSPPLAWNSVPQGTRSLALIVEDPDAPFITFTHWVIFNLPPTTTGLPERVPVGPMTSFGARQGKNTLRTMGYDGPKPPTKKPHRYFFKLYALDAMLDLNPGCSKKELLKAMEGHIVGQGQLIGIYQKQ